ncbi:MAG: heavy-metal-associated domain-containing protein [Caldilinea sp.]|nr:heavy-metal-associated domain-containing protein [Caldilinea sp.]
MTTKTYMVPAISCGHCTATIERELKLVAGLQQVKADLATRQVTVEAQNEAVLSAVEQTLIEIGYPAV